MSPKEDQKTPIFSKDSAISIGVVVSMIIAAVWTATNHQISRNEINNQRETMIQLEKKVIELSSEIKTHEAKGIDGYPHPEGVINLFNQLKGGQTDRWKKADDFIFMKDLCTLNSLKMPPHMTFEEAARIKSTENK
jgi:hypothetical protein